MATYTELHALRGSASSEALMKKISVAIVIKANGLAKSSSPTAAQKDWALKALAAPDNYTGLVFNYIIGEYNTVATSAILGATDTQIQAAVDATVNTLLGV